MNALLHNTMHEQALWAYLNDFDGILADDGDYEYFVSAYVNVRKEDRVNVGYVLH